jgi:hypothetical protein
MNPTPETYSCQSISDVLFLLTAVLSAYYLNCFYLFIALKKGVQRYRYFYNLQYPVLLLSKTQTHELLWGIKERDNDYSFGYRQDLEPGGQGRKPITVWVCQVSLFFFPYWAYLQPLIQEG